MSKDNQLDMFIAVLGDVALRDDRDAMSLPMVSLSKRKRVKPINWQSPDGKMTCEVNPHSHYGMATIWDLDLIIWAIGQLNEQVEKGDTNPSRTIAATPYDIMKSVGWDASGRDYKRLLGALDRLQTTQVKTSLKRGAVSAFTWLQSYSYDPDRDHTLEITIPEWVHTGVVKDRTILSISPDYYGLTGGVERWLYRLSRRHAGRQKTGWRFTMQTLWERSGSTRAMKDFAGDIRRIVKADNLPEYHLELGKNKDGDEILIMIQDAAKSLPPRRKDIRAIL